MSIRSENNKILLKIESMANRNERLVNISRKFLFIILHLNIDIFSNITIDTLWFTNWFYHEFVSNSRKKYNGMENNCQGVPVSFFFFLIRITTFFIELMEKKQQKKSFTKSSCSQYKIGKYYEKLTWAKSIRFYSMIRSHPSFENFPFRSSIIFTATSKKNQIKREMSVQESIFPISPCARQPFMVSCLVLL